MKNVTKIVMIATLAGVLMGINECEGNLEGLCVEVGSGNPADPVNPYEGATGNMNTCADFPFIPCKQDCSLGTGSCRASCCSPGTQQIVDEECSGFFSAGIEAVDACIAEREQDLCGEACLSSCHDCANTCGAYYVECSGAESPDALGWGWDS